MTASEATPLNASTLASIGERVAVPSYAREDVTVGIVHFGVGGFHRAHQAMYLDRLMNDGQGTRLGHLRGRPDAARPSGCATPSTARTGSTPSCSRLPDGPATPRVIGSIIRVPLRARRPRGGAREDGRSRHPHRLADRDRGRLQHRPRHRRVRLTNAGVVRRPAGGRGARTTFGFVTEALARRRARGIAPFTVSSCDNIQGNGPWPARSSRRSPGCAIPSWPTGSKRT